MYKLDGAKWAARTKLGTKNTLVEQPPDAGLAVRRS